MGRSNLLDLYELKIPAREAKIIKQPAIICKKDTCLNIIAAMTRYIEKWNKSFTDFWLSIFITSFTHIKA